MSHRDLVSIIPYSSVANAEEADDKITARNDTRRTQPVATGNQRASSPDRRDAIRELVGCLDKLPDNGVLLADDDRSSPGSSVTRTVVDFLVTSA